MVILKNNTLAVHSIGLSKGAKALVPGENIIEKSLFDILVKHPVVKERLSTGKYSLVNRSSQSEISNAKESDKNLTEKSDADPEVSEEPVEEESIEKENSSDLESEDSEKTPLKKGRKKKN